MSEFINNIELIQNNVFVLTPILITFYRNMDKRENNILLAYFVFPIVFNQECLNNLKVINAASKLNRIYLNEQYMTGFSERFEYYKDITNRCLQYAVDCNYIKIESDLSIVVNKEIYSISNPALNKSFRLASQLHKIFTLDVLNTYLAFGVKHL